MYCNLTEMLLSQQYYYFGFAMVVLSIHLVQHLAYFILCQVDLILVHVYNMVAIIHLFSLQKPKVS
mgnify:CR=1 FL=1